MPNTTPAFEVTQEKDFSLHFEIDAHSGNDSFRHSGTVTRRAATLEKAKEILSHQLQIHFWPRVGQLLAREITIVPA